MTLQLKRKLFTVEEYHRLADEGFIKPTDRVELINGEIIVMSPIKSKHAGTVAILLKILFRQILETATILCQSPIVINNSNSEPEPDLVIAKLRSDSYKSSHPTPDDIDLIIEVSESTIVYDQTVKSALYAKANIPEYWIVNLADQQIEVYRQPKNGEYHFKQIISEPGLIRAEKINLTLDFNEVFNL